MLKKVSATIIPLVFLFSLFLPLVSSEVFAQIKESTGVMVKEQSVTKTCTGNECKLQNHFAFSSVGELVRKLLEIVVKVGWVLAFFFLIWSGFLFVTAGGSEEKLKTAKATFIWTIVGSAIVLGAQVLSVLIENTVKNVVGS